MEEFDQKVKALEDRLEASCVKAKQEQAALRDELYTLMFNESIARATDAARKIEIDGVTELKVNVDVAKEYMRAYSAIQAGYDDDDFCRPETPLSKPLWQARLDNGTWVVQCGNSLKKQKHLEMLIAYSDNAPVDSSELTQKMRPEEAPKDRALACEFYSGRNAETIGRFYDLAPRKIVNTLLSKVGSLYRAAHAGEISGCVLPNAAFLCAYFDLPEIAHKRVCVLKS